MNKTWESLVMMAGALAVVGASCGVAGETGILSAARLGDVSNPPPERAPADAELVAQCGTGDLTEAGLRTVTRAPYVQNVGTQAASVLWTTSSSTPAEVVVTAPGGGKGTGGAEVARVAATVDTGATVGGGARQLVARIPGLAPGTLYCYQVLEGGAPLVEPTGLRTAPASGRVRFVAMGDSGEAGSDQSAVFDAAAQVPFDLWISTGDVAFPDGTLAELEDGIFAAYSRLLRSIPLYPALGNHDYNTGGAAPFLGAFELPGNERTFSYDWGDVHFVALDTERYSNEQSAWLDADLTANQKPWTIVYAHRPPFSSGSHGSDYRFENFFSPILEKHGVKLVFVGHDHHYERTKPVRGVTYVVTGGGGAETRKPGISDFTAFSEQVLHFVYVVIDGDTLTLYAIDATGKMFDSAVIHR